MHVSCCINRKNFYLLILLEYLVIQLFVMVHNHLLDQSEPKNYQKYIPVYQVLIRNLGKNDTKNINITELIQSLIHLILLLQTQGQSVVYLGIVIVALLHNRLTLKKVITWKIKHLCNNVSTSFTMYNNYVPCV